MANMLINDQELSDFVVAKGTSGTWRYIKYANGFAQCWAKYRSTNESYGAGPGGFPYAHKVEIPLPFSFYEQPVGVITCHTGSGFTVPTFTSEPFTTTHCKPYWAANDKSPYTTVWVLVQGLWKALT